MTFSSNPHLLQIITTTAATAANNSASSSVTHSPSISPRADVAGGGGSGSGGGGSPAQQQQQGQNQACAACKFQRRKCNPDCPLARYFPADQQQRFLNAHRLFGVRNIQRTLHDTDPEFRQEAMRALIFQADARASDPAGGCYRIAVNLQNQLDHCQAELAAVLAHLALCRQQAAAIAAADTLVADPGMLFAADATPAHDQDDVVVDSLYADHETTSVQDHYALAVTDQAQPPQPHQLYDYFYYSGTAADDETSSHAWSNVDNNMQQQYGNDAGGGVKTRSPGALSEQLERHCQIETQFVDAFDTKPDIATAMEHRGNSSIDRLEGKVPAVVKNEVDHHHATHMAESSTASRCQLKLGFSCF